MYQDTNRKQKDILNNVQISKQITFHSAHHICYNALFTLDDSRDICSQIIKDTKGVVSNHYTKEDMGVTIKDLEKYSRAMKVKKEEPGPYQDLNIEINNKNNSEQHESIDPEFVAKIRESENDAESGKVTVIKTSDLWK